jgi:hypothetical protein
VLILLGAIILTVRHIVKIVLKAHHKKLISEKGRGEEVESKKQVHGCMLAYVCVCVCMVHKCKWYLENNIVPTGNNWVPW